MTDDQVPVEPAPAQPIRPVDGGPVYCRSCQAEFAPDDAFCPKCGTARAAVTPTVTETQVMAPVTEVVAPVVHERITERPRAPLVAEEPRSSGWLIALAVLAGLLLIVVLFLALRPRDDGTPASTTTTVAPVTPVAPPQVVPLPTVTVTVAPTTTAAPTTTSTAPPTTTTTASTTTTTIP